MSVVSPSAARNQAAAIGNWDEALPQDPYSVRTKPSVSERLAQKQRQKRQAIKASVSSFELAQEEHSGNWIERLLIRMREKMFERKLILERQRENKNASV